MSGRVKERYKVQRDSDNRIFTVTAQSHRGAKKAYMERYDDGEAVWLYVWPMDGVVRDKRRMRA